VLVQYDDEDNEFEKLMSKFENMSKELDDLCRKQRKQACELETKEMKQARELDDLHRKQSIFNRKQARVDLFLEDSQELVVRAFLDYVLYTFNIAAKVELKDTVQRTLWLFSPEATTFVQEHKNVHLIFKEFDNNYLLINTTLLRHLQLAKRTSSDLNKATCHSSTPGKVAIALQELPSSRQTKSLRQFSRRFSEWRQVTWSKIMTMENGRSF
jgi:hypothetical protein